MRVLVIEDDRRLLRLLRRVLEDERYIVDAAYDGVEGEDLAGADLYDLIVLDVMLPGRDGVAVCQNLRRAGTSTPILMLTARDTVRDRVRGLDAGADDYLVKPFASEELIARLRALGRRKAQDVLDACLAVDDLAMDLVRHQVRRDGQPIDLTPREYALLEYFMRRPGHALSRAQLLAGVWPYDTDVTSNIVDSYIHMLRDKIDRGRQRKLLHTVRGVGYALRP